MKLTAFRIKNFKCFQDTGEIALSEGMNIVCGQNNAGKTALLEALALRFPRVPHRSIASLPNRGELGPAPSEIQFTISLPGTEFDQLTRNRTLHLAIPPDKGSGHPLPLGPRYVAGLRYTDPRNLQQLWNWIIEKPEILFQLTRSVLPANNNTLAKVTGTTLPSHNLFTILPGDHNSSYLLKQIQPNGDATFTWEPGAAGNFQDIGEAMSNEFIGRIYRFSAERFGLGEAHMGINKTLAPDASNLPEVLNILQSNATAHEEFVSLVNEILPQIKWVNVEPIESNKLRVNVWTIDRRHKRDDLSIALTQSGTGIGQVLSILYVAFASEHSRVLLLDEPQSFLHPGAARKLIEVLKRFPQHQYIISTHSASIIAAADSSEVLILRSDQGRSRIETEDARDKQTMQSFLQEVGARLSDVFGMDRVVWVEGPTEEKAFPLLLERTGKPLSGTSIVSIRNTGDLEGRDKKRIFEIYNNLTGKASILPPAVAFILDSESRDEEKKNEIRKLSAGKAHFLPRRTLENYLLNPGAICAAINKIENFTGTGPVTSDQMSKHLAGALGDEKYWRPFDISPSPNLEDPKLNGALILEDMFATLSGHRFPYRKTEHSVSLFQWLLDHDLDQLGELASFLVQILESAPA